jgi:hypothetical protein
MVSVTQIIQCVFLRQMNACPDTKKKIQPYNQSKVRLSSVHRWFIFPGYWYVYKYRFLQQSNGYDLYAHHKPRRSVNRNWLYNSRRGGAQTTIIYISFSYYHALKLVILNYESEERSLSGTRLLTTLPFAGMKQQSHAQDSALHSHLTWKAVSPYNVTSEFLSFFCLTVLHQQQDTDTVQYITEMCIK